MILKHNLNVIASKWPEQTVLVNSNLPSQQPENRPNFLKYLSFILYIIYAYVLVPWKDYTF